jgi:hypothetical protein
MSHDNSQRSTPPPPLPRKERDEEGPTWTREVSDEFRRFEDLSRRLVTVPKKELDERRKESKG